MPSRRRSGLSLTELLVAVIILSVLAAMLFPVFARERRMARTAVCLSNIRIIAQAVRMYVDDNAGSLPPRERDLRVMAYFNTRPGGGRRRSVELGSPCKLPVCHRGQPVFAVAGYLV